jgi:hypothetical protein
MHLESLGSYTEAEGYQALEKSLREVEEGSPAGQALARLYYLALPPSAYSSVVAGLKLHCDLQNPPPKCATWLQLSCIPTVSVHPCHEYTAAYVAHTENIVSQQLQLLFFPPGKRTSGSVQSAIYVKNPETMLSVDVATHTYVHSHGSGYRCRIQLD